MQIALLILYYIIIVEDIRDNEPTKATCQPFEDDEGVKRVEI